jgi:hypothetical protein
MGIYSQRALGDNTSMYQHVVLLGKSSEFMLRYRDWTRV